MHADPGDFPKHHALALYLGELTYDDETRPWLDNARMRVYAHIVMVNTVSKKESSSGTTLSGKSNVGITSAAESRL